MFSYSVITDNLFAKNCQSLFSIINAPIMPGSHPHKERRNTIINLPIPWSITANGGNIIANIMRKQDINTIFINDTNILIFEIYYVSEKDYYFLKFC